MSVMEELNKKYEMAMRGWYAGGNIMKPWGIVIDRDTLDALKADSSAPLHSNEVCVELFGLRVIPYEKSLDGKLYLVNEQLGQLLQNGYGFVAQQNEVVMVVIPPE